MIDLDNFTFTVQTEGLYSAGCKIFMNDAEAGSTVPVAEIDGSVSPPSISILDTLGGLDHLTPDQVELWTRLFETVSRGAKLVAEGEWEQAA